ncbi:MAG: hypothetical protein ABSF34_01520, partial [Verrucomicrobiota bacterium]
PSKDIDPEIGVAWIMASEPAKVAVAAVIFNHFVFIFVVFTFDYVQFIIFFGGDSIPTPLLDTLDG